MKLARLLYSTTAAIAALTALPNLVLAGEAPGATVPWVTYEAEQAKINGTVLGPEYSGFTAAREASGRKCVRLASTGQFVEFTAKSDAQGLVVRYSIPDSPKGGGADATLSLSINGKPQPKLSLTSRYSHLYGAYPYTNDPASGSPRNFWDELRLMPTGAIHAGDVVRIQKDADDAASEYLIDLIDLETVPPPIQQPVNSVSVTDFGATPDDQTDDRPAFINAYRAAQDQHKSLWIPPGRFVLKGALKVHDIEIRGAGMWYSTLLGVDDYTPQNRVAIYGGGSNVHLADFAIVGKLTYRNDTEPNDGLGESFGTGSTIRNIWVEHTKTGAWLVNADGLLVEGCRFRDTIADGINLCIGMHNTTVRNCTARGTGDDCFAMWPAVYAKSVYTHGGNRFVHCTGQLPFLAQAFSIYGGEGNRVEDCAAIDIPTGAGLFASTTFPTEFGFRGNTVYRNCRLTRCGCDDGAIGLVGNMVDLPGVHFEDIEAIDSVTDGIKFTSINGHAVREATFDRIRIVNPGISGDGYGIVAAPGAVGSATVSNVTVIQPKSGGIQINSPAFELIRSAGNTGLESASSSSGVSDINRPARDTLN